MANQDSPTFPPSDGGAEQRSCWECSRRRLVCDEDRPTCRKCRDAGIVCPGYSGAKPLRWLAPGRVTARIRKKPNRRKGDSEAAGGTSKAKAKAKRAAAANATTSESNGASPGPSDAGAEEIGQLSLYEGGGKVSDVPRRPEPNWFAWEIPRSLPRGLFVTNETEVVQATYYCTAPFLHIPGSHPPNKV